MALRVVGTCGQKVVHPCRDKSFRKAVSAVMDDLVTHSEIIAECNNKNLITKILIIKFAN